MTDVATLALAVDSRQVADGSKALDGLTASGAKAEGATKSLSSATSVLSGLYKGLAAAASAYKIADLIRDSAMLAARFETMGVVMKIAGNNAGYTRAEMDAYSAALQSSGISMLQSRNALTQLATAHIDLANASKLGRAAQDLAVVANINSSAAMERLIHGIKSGETEILRTMGLNVNFEASYRTMAAQLGTTSDKLTEHQKVIARTNAALKEAANYNGIYEESMTTAGKAMSSLTRYWEDFKVKSGEVFLPTLADGVFTLTDALKAANTELTKAGGSGGGIESVGAMFDGVFKTALQTAAVLGANVAFVLQGIGREIGGIAAQAAAVGRGDFKGAGSIGDQIKADAEASRAALDAFEAKMLGTASVVITAEKQIEAQRIATGRATQAAADASEKMQKALEEAAKAAKKAESEYAGLLKTLREKLATDMVELENGGKLTEAQKTRADVEAKLAEILRQNPKLHADEARAILDKIVAVEQETEAKKRQAEVEAEYYKQYYGVIEQRAASTKQIEDETKAMREHTQEMGLSAEQLLKLRQSRIDDRIAKEQAKLSSIDETNQTKAEAEAIRDTIEALEDRKKAMSQQATTKKATEEQAALWKDIERAGHDAFMHIGESGRDVFQRLQDTLKNGLLEMLYQMTVKKWIVQIQAETTGFPSGGGGGGGGGIFGGLGDLFSSAWSGIEASPGFVGPPSFAGGGDTGNGPRSGGIDGRGGFLATLHPQETVIDRTMDGGGSNGAISISMPVTIDARGADPSVVPRINQALAETEARIYRNIPAVVRQAQVRKRVSPTV